MDECYRTAAEMNYNVLRKLLEYKKTATVSDPHGIFTPMTPSRRTKDKELAAARERVRRSQHDTKLLHAIDKLNRNR